jgi:hypothetical protein
MNDVLIELLEKLIEPALIAVWLELKPYVLANHAMPATVAASVSAKLQDREAPEYDELPPETTYDAHYAKTKANYAKMMNIVHGIPEEEVKFPDETVAEEPKIDENAHEKLG